MSEHAVTISTAHIAATCSCGWTSEAVANYVGKLAQGDAHMYEHHAVFAQNTERDGTTVLCWGVS